MLLAASQLKTSVSLYLIRGARGFNGVKPMSSKGGPVASPFRVLILHSFIRRSVIL